MPEHHRLPHLFSFKSQPIVFLTVVTHTRRPVLTNQTAFDCLTGLWERSPAFDGWFVGDYLLMPDHVHLFARPSHDTKKLAEWLETWKSVSARHLKSAGLITPPLWQRDYFDRFLRSAGNYSEKWDYVAANPVRAGLCATHDEWPWHGRLHDLKF